LEDERRNMSAFGSDECSIEEQAANVEYSSIA